MSVHPKHAARLATVVLGASVLLASMGSVASAVDTTTSTEATTTTTMAPTTTTTTPTTTTTAATTTTRPAKPTTTITKPTTTTTVAPTSSTNSMVWAWVLGALALLGLLAVAVFGLVGASRKKKAGDAWLPSARATWESAVLARGMLVAQPTGGDTQLPKVRAQGEDAARSLDRVAASAPDDQGRQATARVAESLRGVLFTLEAENLLRNGPTPPTAEQLAEADIARRHRSSDLDAALAQLDQFTRPPAR